ncbi:hypothetical protein QP246_02320 [Aerococcus urinae]|uniref:hypothetical protein n=1 Tax=Aerococcus urinae TaxID=1376 RepID=UPI00255054E4|nr:hypothetical protein [Aerococcus urinae]MDK6688294.1 hypothetical protein [Aerococcus urinae]
MTNRDLLLALYNRLDSLDWALHWVRVDAEMLEEDLSLSGQEIWAKQADGILNDLAYVSRAYNNLEEIVKEALEEDGRGLL